MDRLERASSDGVRVFAAVTTDLVNDAAARHGCGALATAALGRVMTGALLMAADLKNDECITVRLKGDGPLGAAVADASARGFVRGYVTNPEIELPLTNGKLSVGQGIGRGILSVTRFTGLKSPVTGSIEIYSGEIAEDLTQYLARSEQTPSGVGLGVLVGTDGRARAAGGFIMQPMPGAAEDTLARLERNLASVRSVSEIIDDGADEKDIIGELLKGFSKINFLGGTELSFRCQCSRERTGEILASLAREDLASLVDDGSAEVRCDFCGEKYIFGKEELCALLSDKEKQKRA